MEKVANNDADHKFDLELSFKPPFDKMLEPIKDDISEINNAIKNNSLKLEKLIDMAKDHIQDFLEYGLSDVDNPTNMTTHSNNGYFLGIIVRVTNFWWALVRKVRTIIQADILNSVKMKLKM